MQRTRIGSASVIPGGSVITNSIGAPALISVSRYMKTPRELTSRVCPANSRWPLFRNFTEMGRSSENRRVVRFSGCGCAMLKASKYSGSLGMILAYVAGILLDILAARFTFTGDDRGLPRIKIINLGLPIGRTP